MEGRVFVIVGPTCSGKTSLSISLSERINCEIISADSRQIYKLLNIGTAKPGPEILKKVKHHFVDFLNPDEDYNASQFETDALKVIKKIISKNKMPLVAGGSGLYIKALIDGISSPAAIDQDLREELLKKRQEYGNEYLFDELKKVDPISASTMLPQNWKRVIRALEVFYLTGKSITEYHRFGKRKENFEFIQFGLQWDRPTLYKNINDRVDRMISDGLIDEVKSILSLGYVENLNALNTVGYKEIISYLEGKISLDEAIFLMKRNTRHYAKRQMTWFKKDTGIKWFNIYEYAQLDQIAGEIIRSFTLHKLVFS